MGKVRYAVEPYGAAVAEMRDLYEEHWAEVALDRSVIKLNPDYETYNKLEQAGVIHLVTARDDGVLVGYYLCLVHPHLHYKDSLTAFPDIFFLRKDYRKGWTGYRLLKHGRDSLKARGVQKIYISTKLHIDLDAIVRRLGFKQIERVYALTFGGG